MEVERVILDRLPDGRAGTLPELPAARDEPLAHQLSLL